MLLKPLKLIALWLALVLPAAAAAGEAAPASDDPALEARVMEIAVELRCLVCQNQTIADSHAELAVDLRRQVRDMLRRGDSRDQILAYMTQRYGDFVLYRPPLKESTWLLWFGPLLLVLGGVTILVFVLRSRMRLPAESFEPDQLDLAETAGPETTGAARPAP